MKLWLFSVLSAFLLSACSGVTITIGPTATPELPPTPTATPVPVIHVVPSGASPEKQTVRVETHPQNNCGGSGDSKTIFTQQHAVSYQLQLGQNWTVSANGQVGIPGVGNVEVGAAVATHYGVSYGQTQVQSHSLELIAPAGKRMEHILRHVELWDTGTIVMTLVGQEHRIPYKFPVGYRIEQQDSVELVCDFASAPLATHTSTPPAIAADIPTPVSPTAMPTPVTSVNKSFSVLGNLENGMRVDIPVAGTYLLEYEGNAYSGWPTDTYAGNQGWATHLQIFFNRPVEWGLTEYNLEGPVNFDAYIGAYGFYMVKDEAVAATRGKSAFLGRLDAGDYITFVVVDEKGSYLDNRGQIDLILKRIGE